MEVRQISLCDFFLGDHRVSMIDNEVLVGIRIPLPKSSNKYFLRSYKQARRRDDSKGIVSAGFQIELEQSNFDNHLWKIISACFSFSGMASKTIVAINTQQQLIGLFWTKETINEAYQLLLKEMPLNEFNPDGQPEFKLVIK
jgi:xanthine dehydrogenase iron-sulfur cluster and FAD-binding subunit A